MWAAIPIGDWCRVRGMGDHSHGRTDEAPDRWRSGTPANESLNWNNTSLSEHVVITSARQLVTIGTRGTSASGLSWLLALAWLGRLFM